MKILITLFIISVFTFNALAQLKLPSAISDGMILQQKMKVPIWGWATPNSGVSVKFMGQNKSTSADAEGD